MEYDGGRREVVRVLCARLDQENDRTRWCAAKALGKMGAREAVPALINCLRHDPDPDVRMQAAAALGTLEAHEAVDVLTRSLHDDPDGDVRLQACQALGTMRHPRALDALLTCLRADEALDLDDWDTGDDLEFDVIWEIQRETLERLGDIGDTRAVEAIIQLMASESYDDLQALGLRTLATLGGEHAIGFVLQQLQEGNPVARRRAARALAPVQDAMVIQPLITALGDGNPEVRIAAGWALATRQDSTMVPAFTRLLQDPWEAVRSEAAVMVTHLASDAVVEPLIRLLRDRKRAVQYHAVQVLGERREARATAPMLTLLARPQHDEALAGALIKALECIRAPEALMPLCRLLKDGHVGPATRLQAALALGEISTGVAGGRNRAENQNGAESSSDELDLIEILMALVGDDDPQVCHAALLALSKIGGDRASVALLEALQGEIPEPGEDAKSAAPAFTCAETGLAAFPTSTLAAMQTAQASHDMTVYDLSERRRLVRCYAASVIRDTGSPAVREALLQAAQDNDPDLRCQALLALGHGDDRDAIAVMIKGCRDEAREVRIAAIEALGQRQPDEAVDALMEQLRTEHDPLVGQRAIEVLGVLGDTRATACIVARLHDDDRHVRRAALEALACLGDSTAIEAVRPLLFTHGGELWKETVMTLQRLGDSEVSGLLLETLIQVEHEDTHWVAIEALAELYTPS